MLGDQENILAKLKLALVSRWFASSTPGSDSSTPILDGVLSGPAWMWSWLYDLLQYVAKQRRIGTADGVNLDQIAADFFGLKLGRFTAESDQTFRARIKANLLAPKATRQSIIDALLALTNLAPKVFEPALASDTGGYGFLGMTVGTGLGYGAAGGYGSLSLPFQAFITAYRPVGQGISGVQGYYKRGSGLPAFGGYGAGAIEYASLNMLAGLITDQDIYQTIADAAPEATIMWTAITEASGPISGTPLQFPVIGTLFAQQASQTLNSNLFGGDYTAALFQQQLSQTFAGSASSGSILGHVTLTQDAQTLSAAGVQFSGWNPSDSLNMTVSNAGITAAPTTSSRAGVRSYPPISVGKRYFQVATTTALAGEAVGIAAPGWPLTSALGAANNSIAVDSLGHISFNGSIIGEGSPWVAGGLLDLAIDLDGKLFWHRVNNGAWSAPVGTLSGTATAGTSGPIVSGPASASLAASHSINLTGCTVSDTAWPTTSSVSAAVNASAGTVRMTLNGNPVSGSGTAGCTVSGQSADIQSALATLSYTAPATAASATVSITVTDQFGQHNTLTIPVTVAAPSSPDAGTGGVSFTGISSTTLMTAYSTAVAAAQVTADWGTTAFTDPLPSLWVAWNAPAGAAPTAPTVTTGGETTSSVTLTWT